MTGYKVERLFAYGWDDAEWTIDGEPQRFDTKADAQAAIYEHIADCSDAIRKGFMDGPAPKATHFRIVPA